MRSIRSRLSAMTAIAILISVVALGLVSLQFIRKITNDSTNELLKLSCERNDQEVNVYLDSIEQCVDTVAYFAAEEFDGFSDEEIKSYMDEVNVLFHSVVNSTRGVVTYYFRLAPEVNENIGGFWYARRGTTVFTPSEITDVTKYSEDDIEHVGWYYLPKNGYKAMWLEPYENENLGGLKMISYVAPVYKHGRFIGVVGIDYDYEILCRNVEYSGSYDTGFAFLCDDDTVIYHPEVDSGTPVAEISPKLTRDQLSTADPIIRFEYNDKAYRGSWSELANHMLIYFAVEESEVNNLWIQLAIVFTLIAAAILMIFTLLSTYVSNRMIQPLTDLTEAAIRLDKGDYNVELDYSGSDEIGVLAGAFRQLTSHLKAYISDLNDMAYKDALTSVRNKAAFDMYLRKLEDRISGSEDGRKPEFAICMFDCNGLKGVNDNFGHDKGDIYLKKSCSLICEIFKHSPVFRLGGDEFACILQNEDFARRKKLCTSFDKACEQINESAERLWDRVDIACGIAAYKPGRDNGTESVLKRADERMYEDKRHKKSGDRSLQFGRYVMEE